MEPFRREPSDRTNPTTWSGEVGHDHPVYHEEHGRRGKTVRGEFQRRARNIYHQAVQSRPLRKLQLARGGFGLSKDVHSSERVAEIMVRYHTAPCCKSLICCSRV
jgi:hypothetical protein